MKNLLVLARNDCNEAMRVAAGLTIFGHEVELVVLCDTQQITADNEHLEVLELAEIEPLTTRENAAAPFKQISFADLQTNLAQADAVFNF